MNGKDFEQLCIFRMDAEKRRGRGTMNRMGVHCSIRFDPVTKTQIAQPISSPPDFEGVEPDGRQFMFDTKVCSAASFRIEAQGGSGSGKREIPFLLDRSVFNVATFLLIHFPERQLKTKTDEAMTVAFPVHVRHPFWIAYDAGEVRSINRQSCDEYGCSVEWSTTSQRGRKETPDVLAAVRAVRGELRGFNEAKLLQHT